MTAAAARAAHLLVDDEPHIFRDTLAALLLGDRRDELLAYHHLHGAHPVLAGARAAVVTRSRYTEDALTDSGLTQYVVLGAGLDSYAHRGDPGVHVFEVDRPATQEWKKAVLRAAGRTHPQTLTYVPTDLGRDSVHDRLVAAGLDAAAPAFVGWLGVTIYLPRAAIEATLADLSRLPAGSLLVMEHFLPAEHRDARGQEYVDAVMPATADYGEPWLTFLDAEAAAALLRDHGFTVRAQVEQRDALDPSLWRRTDPLTPSRLTMLTLASRD
jgi:methyltransferase (TIGR00027 family)